MRTILALALLGLLLACAEEAPPVELAPPVVVVPVVARDLDVRIEANGELIARNQAWVAAEVAGRVTEIVRDEGLEVAQGEVVASIDPERRRLEVAEARAGVVQADAQAAEAAREHTRIRTLHEKGVASQARLEQLETQLRLARSRRESARARLGVAARALADAEVRAPFDGVIAERTISVGEFVQPGKPLFELVTLDPIDVEFRLPEVDASRVALGQQVDVRVAPWPDEVFSAVVRFIGPRVDPQTHTLLVRAAVDNADRRLRPGFFAAVDLGVASRKAVALIPEEAVLQRADGAVAFRVGADLRVERLLIETGEHRDGLVEIVAGLAPGDRIVVRGHYALTNGAQVQPRTPDGQMAGDVAEGPPPAGTATP
jgi:membrane fusion protein (multidrug efflux system)